MKRGAIFILIATAIAAHCVEPSGFGSYIMGGTSGGTSLAYVAGFGDWSLYDADTILYGLYAGQSAGAYGNGHGGCVALGHAAMAKATNCTDCVAIGKRVGQNWRNANGWVQVGDAFAYTNGYLNIKAPTGGYDIAGILRPGEGGAVGLWANGVRSAEFARGGVEVYGGLSLVYGEYGGSLTCGLASCRDLTVNGRGQFGADSNGSSIFASGDIQTAAHVEAQTIGSQTNSTQALVLYGYSYNVTLAMDAQDHLCVYTNGVKVGRLSIVPDP